MADGRDRFSWNDEDVELKDEKGKVLTPREALERQLEQLRADAEQEDDGEEEE